MRFERCGKGSSLEAENIDMRTAISVQHLTKQFRIPLERRHTTYARVAARIRCQPTEYEEFNAVNDLSFRILHGETVGVIGPNGSGKSTLLKLLAGVLYPTKGCVLVQGRVAPFLELGVGFEQQLTARENIYLYGAIMHMSRREIDRKYWEILDFAELRRFENMKLHNFSSGMQLRLGFSIAIQTRPDILLVDEVLAVGDEAFQQKCMEKIEEIRKNGKTILFVSHELKQIRAVCKTCMLLQHGQIAAIGTPDYVIDEYHQAIAREDSQSSSSILKRM
jgi:lipopolysaccharide transport system ATP-binding protein